MPRLMSCFRALICSSCSSRKRIQCSISGSVKSLRYGMESLVALLELDQRVHAVQGHTAIVADDAAAAVGIRQAGEDLVVASYLDLLGVHAEDAVVVGLAVLGEDLLDLRIGLLAGFLDGLLDHAPATVRHHRALAAASVCRPTITLSTSGESM